MLPPHPPSSSLLLLLLLLLLFGNQELAKWNVRWDEARLLRKHHIGASASDISVKVTEMFEGVVTGSQVPAVCTHLRELAPSHPPTPLHPTSYRHPSSPLSLLLFLNLFLCLVVITFIAAKNLSMAGSFVLCFFFFPAGAGWSFDRGGRRCSCELKLEELLFGVTRRHVIFHKAAGSLSVTAAVRFNHLRPNWRHADG